MGQDFLDIHYLLPSLIKYHDSYTIAIITGGPTGAVDTPTLNMNTHGTYVFILDSNSEIGAHVLSKIDNFFPFFNFKPWLDTPKLSLGTEKKTNSPSSAYNVTFKRQSTW